LYLKLVYKIPQEANFPPKTGPGRGAEAEAPRLPLEVWRATWPENMFVSTSARGGGGGRTGERSSMHWWTIFTVEPQA
jgi:hypothetical protein